MSTFLRKKPNNPKLKQNELAMQLGCSDSTVKKYRNQIHMLNPYDRKKNESKKISCMNGSKTLENVRM